MGETLAEIPLQNKFKRINTIFAFIFVCLPFLLFVLGIFVQFIKLRTLYLFWAVLYSALFFFYLPKNVQLLKLSNYKSKLLKTALILIFALYILVILSSIVTQTFGQNTIEMLSYPLLFFCIVSLDKKYIKLLLQLLLGSIVFSALLSMIDPFQVWVPGFISLLHPYSSFFWHFNYSATVSVVILTIVVNLLIFGKNKKLKVLYSFYFIVLSAYLYFNASLASIIAFYLVSIFELVFFSIKNKCFMWQFLVIIFASAIISILIELFSLMPETDPKRYNFFVECTAVFDNIFGTNLLQKIFGLDHIDGADGWHRREHLIRSLHLAIGGEKTTFMGKLKAILFGIGCGAVNENRPHNMFVGVWLDFGLLATLVNSAIIILILTYMVKQNKYRLPKIYPYFFAGVVYLFVTLLGSLMVYHYTYFVCIMALGTKIAHQAKLSKKVANKAKIKLATQKYVASKNVVYLKLSIQKQ